MAAGVWSGGSPWTTGCAGFARCRWARAYVGVLLVLGRAQANPSAGRHGLDQDLLTRQRVRAPRAHPGQLTGGTAGAATLYHEAAALTEDRYLLDGDNRLT